MDTGKGVTRRNWVAKHAGINRGGAHKGFKEKLEAMTEEDWLEIAEAACQKQKKLLDKLPPESD